MRYIYGLSAVLTGRDRRDYLRGYGTGSLEGAGAFNHFPVHDGTLFKHVLDIYKAAIENGLQKVVRVVEVNSAFVMRLGYVFGKKYSARKVF